MTQFEQIKTCMLHAQKWKKLALATNDSEEQKKAAEKAFFWLELEAAFTYLWAIEQTQGKNPAVKRKLIVAKVNLAQKLADYTDKVWKEIQVG